MPPPIDAGGGEERGPATITTYADGATAGELEVYVHDDAGELRGGHRSGPDGLPLWDQPGWTTNGTWQL